MSGIAEASKGQIRKTWVVMIDPELHRYLTKTLVYWSRLLPFQLWALCLPARQMQRPDSKLLQPRRKVIPLRGPVHLWCQGICAMLASVTVIMCRIITAAWYKALVRISRSSLDRNPQARSHILGTSLAHRVAGLRNSCTSWTYVQTPQIILRSAIEQV